jgi:hypothetical protein
MISQAKYENSIVVYKKDKTGKKFASDEERKKRANVIRKNTKYLFPKTLMFEFLGD